MADEHLNNTVYTCVPVITLSVCDEPSLAASLSHQSIHLSNCRSLSISVSVSISISMKMIEMECFKEINVYETDGTLCSDLDVNRPNPPPKRGFFYRLFRRQASASAPAAVRGGGG